MHRADGLVGHGRCRGVGKPRNAKVGHLDRAVRQQHDVLRLDIPVDDAALMGMAQGLEHLLREVEGLPPAESPLLLDILL
ncbi:hypothetical protein SDC9_142349 [bioreactor metagenome]|uniref:Uncharacterized protein n=1 Tax=bioreactor metagenome TaxID=1076179 RepID=A0A645E0W5_9ZZZZ